MTPPTTRDAGYSAPSAASVYALAEPDLEPLPRPTRTEVVWDERPAEGGRTLTSWTEIDPATGAVLATGAVQLHPDRVRPEAGNRDLPEAGNK